ncbi:MAG: hypothetical protein M3291_12775, partial [Actinomycetota bacterium]|nr:hypothetical protein [Actinomycetota bacterium]
RTTDSDDRTTDSDGDTEDIDVALDQIEIDMTLEDIQVQINGETVAIDVAISGTGIIVDVDEVTDDPAGSAGDEAPTLDRAPSDTDQVALGAESTRG